MTRRVASRQLPNVVRSFNDDRTVNMFYQMNRVQFGGGEFLATPKFAKANQLLHRIPDHLRMFGRDFHNIIFHNNDGVL